MEGVSFWDILLMRRPGHYVGLDMTGRMCFTHDRGCRDTTRSQGTQDFDGDNQDK